MPLFPKLAARMAKRRAARRARNVERYGDAVPPFLGPLARWSEKLRDQAEAKIADLILVEAATHFGTGADRHARVVEQVITLLDSGVLRFPATPVGIGLELLTDAALRGAYVRGLIEVWVVDVYAELEAMKGGE